MTPPRRLKIALAPLLIGLLFGAAAAAAIWIAAPFETRLGRGDDLKALVDAQAAATRVVLAMRAGDTAEARIAAAELRRAAAAAGIGAVQADAFIDAIERADAYRDGGLRLAAGRADAVAVAAHERLTLRQETLTAERNDRQRRRAIVAGVGGFVFAFGLAAAARARRLRQEEDDILEDGVIAHLERGAPLVIDENATGRHARLRRHLARIIAGMSDREERLQAAIDERVHAEQALAQKTRIAEDALSELQTAQTSLIQAETQASLGGLVAGVAHEVNTPVGVALTAASHLSRKTRALGVALGEGKIGRSAFNDYLATAQESAALIEKNAERAAALIQSFKKVAVDQTSGERRRFGLGDYLGEILLSLGPELHRSGVEAAIDPALAVEIDSYPGAFAQVITNLVMNSLTHGYGEGRGGRIRMTACDAGEGRIGLIYTDDGKGLTPEVARKIFEPFFTTRRGEGGSGLGMHIVYNLVSSRLGGEIAVAPADGPGARFRLTIPQTAPR